jgi:RNA polymerase sigma factor (sigma-70 family)
MTQTGQLLRLARGARSEATDGDLLLRYARDRDEAAFAEVVRRNGPLVLRACRSVLGEATAEDAFQATFLLLARRAARLTRPGPLAGWLHATAVRVARDARRAAARARRREAAREAPRSVPADDLTWREVREVIDAELAALPEKYRVPLVLCYLQELSYEESARRAGCTVGVLRGRLERGKERLRRQLARHGLPLSLPALVLGPPAAVSAALEAAALATVRAATTGGPVPAAVAGLAGQRAGLWAVLLTPAAVALAAVGAVLAGAAHPAADPPAADPPRPAARVAPGEPAPRTDRFGDPLPEGAVMRLGTLRGTANITSFGVAADGAVLTVGSEADVRVWLPNEDSPEPAVRVPLKAPDGWAIRSHASPDAKRVACAAPDAVVVYETRGAKRPAEVATFKIAGATALTFSPDGAGLAVVTGGRAPAVHLCDVKAGKSWALAEGLRHVEQVAFSGDGRRVGVTTWDEFLMWDTASRGELARWAPDGVKLAAVALDRTGGVLAARVYEPATEAYLNVRFLDAQTGRPRAGLAAAAGGHWVSFAPDGKTVLIGDDRGGAVVGSESRKVDPPVRRRDELWTRCEPTGGAVHSRRQGARRDEREGAVPVGRRDRRAALPRGPLGPPLRPGRRARRLPRRQVVRDGDGLPDQGVGRIKVWDAAGGKLVATVPASYLWANNLEFAPDGTGLYTPAPVPGQLSRWEVATGKEARRFTADPRRPAQTMTLGLRLSENGKVLTAVTLSRVRGEETQILTTWDATTGERQFTKELDRDEWRPYRYQLNFSANALHASIYGNVFLTPDGPAKDRLPPRTLGPGFDAGAFSGDGTRIAFTHLTPDDAGNRMQAVVYDPVTGTKLCDLPPGSGGRVALSPNGEVLAAAGLTDLTFWSVTTGKRIARYKSPPPEKGITVYSFARAIRFTPDGTKLLTGHADATALVWAVPAGPAR